MSNDANNSFEKLKY